MELEVHLPSGRRWFTEASAAPIVDDQGNVMAGIAVTTDITERKAAREKLAQTELRYRLLFDKTLEGFADCKMYFEDDKPVDFIYPTVNDAFEKLTGLRNVVGKRVSEVIPGIRDSDPELLEIYGRGVQTRQPETFEGTCMAWGFGSHLCV